MTRLKKAVTTSLLVAMLIIASLLLMACNSNTTNVDSYNLFSETITNYKSNTDLFGSGTIYGVQTDFYLSNFKSKDSSGNLVEDSNNYVAFVAVGLNYIEDNYGKLQEYEEKHDFASLNKKVEKMNDAYDELCKEFANFKNMDSSSNYNIYNGYFARYKESAKAFIEEVYIVAEALGESTINEMGEGVSEDSYNPEILINNLEFNGFLIIKDYKEFLISSCDGEVFDSELFENVQSQLETCMVTLLNKTYNNITREESLAVKDLIPSVATDRENVIKSFEKFSLNEFYNTYDGSLIAYEKNLKNASIYYNFIENYFEDYGILDKLHANLLAI